MRLLSTWGIFASLGFILFLPFPYFLLGFWTDTILYLFNPICEGILGYLGPEMNYFGIESDSAGMWIWLSIILIAAGLLSVLFGNRINYVKIKNWHYVIVAYFLSFILIKYGLDKVLLNQFYFPEPNILYTRVGHLDKSLLYWSSMGSSPVYSIFSGIAEIIPGILLLFRRTRAFGGFIATLVFANVFAINVGFNVDVKLLSFALLCLSVYLAYPFVLLIKSIILSPNQFTRLPLKNRVVEDYKWYSGMKVLIIFFFMIEFIGPVMLKSENPNLEELTGTYIVEVYGDDFTQVPKYIHIHSKGYLIVEYYNDFMEDYSMKINSSQIQLERDNKLIDLNYIKEDYVIVFSRNDSQSSLFFRGRKIDNKLLPLSQNQFQWVAY